MSFSFTAQKKQKKKKKELPSIDLKIEKSLKKSEVLASIKEKCETTSQVQKVFKKALKEGKIKRIEGTKEYRTGEIKKEKPKIICSHKEGELLKERLNRNIELSYDSKEKNALQSEIEFAEFYGQNEIVIGCPNCGLFEVYDFKGIYKSSIKIDCPVLFNYHGYSRCLGKEKADCQCSLKISR